MTWCCASSPPRPECAVADRHHRASHWRGQTLPLRRQGRLLKRIVGYSIADRMTAEWAVDVSRNAVAFRGPAETIVHSDRGSQGGLKRVVAAPRFEGGVVGHGPMQKQARLYRGQIPSPGDRR